MASATEMTRAAKGRGGLPTKAEVVEVGPRDGLQAEAAWISTEDKIAIVEGLIDAGLKDFELTSFVSPKAVPQMRDAAEMVAHFKGRPGLKMTTLIPNARGAERAAEAGVDAMVVFLSASESHNKKNVNRSVAESLEGFREVCRIAEQAKIPVQGAIATSFGCPFEGDVPRDQVVRIAKAYRDMGMEIIALGDTTGMATPPLVTETALRLQKELPDATLALHFHNTRGIGLANVLAGLQAGITRFESSIGGLGGCPFAPGATGNICTEDLVYLLDECGVESGVNLERLIAVAQAAEKTIGHGLPGQLMKAGPRLKLHEMNAVATACG